MDSPPDFIRWEREGKQGRGGKDNGDPRGSPVNLIPLRFPNAVRKYQHVTSQCQQQISELRLNRPKQRYINRGTYKPNIMIWERSLSSWIVWNEIATNAYSLFLNKFILFRTRYVCISTLRHNVNSKGLMKCLRFVSNQMVWIEISRICWRLLANWVCMKWIAKIWDSHRRCVWKGNRRHIIILVILVYLAVLVRLLFR